jgi:hypothetical protein
MSGQKKRRGMAIVGIIVMLAIIHLVIIGSVTSGSRAANVQTLRLEALRAFLAADSGVIVWLRLDAAGLAPESGTSVDIGTQRIIYVSSPGTGEAGTVVVEGQSGRARRRVAVEVE